MRTVNHYKTLGLLALGTLTAIAAAQNRRSNETEPPGVRQHQQGQASQSHSATPARSAPTSPGPTSPSTQGHIPQPASPPNQSRAQFGPRGYGPSGNPAARGGGYHTFGNRAAGEGGNGLPRGAMGSFHSRMPEAGFVPGRHTTVVTQTHGGMRTEHRFAGGNRLVEGTRSLPGRGTVHAMRYGNGLSGVVDRPLRPGYVSRTYVRGGRVLDARVYSQHSFTRFGHTFNYQRVVPVVAFAPTYYTWAVRRWPTPVVYQWGWQKERWYAAYGDYFTPYPSYTSLDLWLTDYVISQNMRASYENWQAETYPDTDPASDDTAQPTAAGASSQSDGQSDSTTPPDSADGDQGSPSPEAAPPPMTPEIKQELNEQIKLQLQERQTQTAKSADEGPSALKPGHKLFRVNEPLDVPSDTPGAVCSLGPDDYIERTGDMDSNGTVPVEVKLSAISDCGTGLVTRVSENDLEAMDSEQQDQLTQAMLAASKSMGPKGLPQAPGATPLLVSAGQTPPDANAPGTLRAL